MERLCWLGACLAGSAAAFVLGVIWGEDEEAERQRRVRRGLSRQGYTWSLTHQPATGTTAETTTQISFAAKPGSPVSHPPEIPADHEATLDQTAIDRRVAELAAS